MKKIMSSLEDLKKALTNKSPLLITMYNENKEKVDRDVFRFIDGKYRDRFGMILEIKEIIKEIKNSTWLDIEIFE